MIVVSVLSVLSMICAGVAVRAERQASAALSKMEHLATQPAEAWISSVSGQPEGTVAAN